MGAEKPTSVLEYRRIHNVRRKRRWYVSGILVMLGILVLAQLFALAFLLVR